MSFKADIFGILLVLSCRQSLNRGLLVSALYFENAAFPDNALHHVPGMRFADHKKFVFLRAKSKTVPL